MILIVMKPISLKENVISYRKRVYAYSMISEIFGLSKSTLSNWLTIGHCKEVIARIGAGLFNQLRQGMVKRFKGSRNLKIQLKENWGNCLKEHLWLLGIGIFGEGNEIVREYPGL